MDIKKLNWGVIITITWIVGIAYIWLFGKLNSPESLNELGDFLAGAFAPIAFLWLVLGYRQQGKQLEQNTRALEQQERALQLQIDEMKISVKQQGELLNLQKIQSEQELKKVEPLIVVNNISFEYFTNDFDQEDPFMINLKFEINNLGQVANEFYIRDYLRRAIYFKEQIASKEVISVSLKLTQEHFFSESNDYTYSVDIPFDFKNIYGIHSYLNYEVYIQLSREDDIEDKAYVFIKS